MFGVTQWKSKIDMELVLMEVTRKNDKCKI